MYGRGVLLLPNFSLLNVGCSSSKRPCRRVRTSGQEDTMPNNEPIPSLEATASDPSGATVYVNLERENDALLKVLRSTLFESQPPTRVLERLQPINKGRVLVEITDQQIHAIFEAWLLDTYNDPITGPSLAQLLAPLGGRLRIVGAQWIVPKVTEYDRTITPQAPHTDVGRKGEVVSIGLHVAGNPMGTLLNPSARVNSDGAVVGWHGFKRTNSSIFAYDTGTVHAGPGRSSVPPPYPRYFTERVFFLLCADSLDSSSVARHRRDNGLYSIDYWQFIRTIQLPPPPPTNAPNLAASTSRVEANVSEDTALPTATPATPPHTR